MEKKREPFDSFDVGDVHVALWNNETKDGRQWANSSISKPYKNGEGKMVDGCNYTLKDLLNLAKAANMAFDQLHAMNRKSRSDVDESNDE